MALTSYGTSYEEDPEFELTAEEKRLLEDAEGMGQFGSAAGSAAGTAAGIGLSLIPPLAPFAPFIVPAATALGGWTGGMIGGNMSKDAAQRYERLREKRLKPLQDRQRRLATFNELAGEWLPNVRGL